MFIHLIKYIDYVIGFFILIYLWSQSLFDFEQCM